MVVLVGGRCEGILLVFEMESTVIFALKEVGWDGIRGEAVVH